MFCNINKFACKHKIDSIKKIISILSRCVIGLVLLVFASYMALMTPFVQTRLVDYFTLDSGRTHGNDYFHRTGGVSTDRIVDSE